MADTWLVIPSKLAGLLSAPGAFRQFLSAFVLWVAYTQDRVALTDQSAYPGVSTRVRVRWSSGSAGNADVRYRPARRTSQSGGGLVRIESESPPEQ